MAMYHVNTDVVAIAAEVTAGTAVTDFSDAANIKVMSAELSVDIQTEKMKFQTGDHAADKSVPGAIPATAKITTPLTFSGSYATAPDNFALLNACGLVNVEYKRAVSLSSASGQKVVNVSTSGSPFVQGQVVTLKEGSNEENCTIATIGTNTLTMVSNLSHTYTTSAFVYTGIGLQPLKQADKSTLSIAGYGIEAAAETPTANQIVLAGLVGTAEIAGEGIGKPIMISCDFSGKYSSNADVANGNIPEYVSTSGAAAETILSTALTIGGESADISKFSLNTGNSVTRIEDVSDASGYLCGLIEKREPSFSCDPIRKSVADDDVFGDVSGAVTAEIVMTTPHFQFRVPKAQGVTPKLANRNGLHSWEKVFECLRNTDDDGTVLDSVMQKEATFEIIQGRRS